MALYLLSRKGHHSCLITPFNENKLHNCAKSKIERQNNISSDYLTALISPSSSEYLFGYKYYNENVQFENYQNSNGSQIIKNATVLSLIEHLTSPRSIDNDFVYTFFTTFRLFCSPTKLLQLLIQRFKVPTPSKICFERAESKCEKLYYHFKDKYKYPIQKRVLQALYFWISNYSYDFQSNSEFLLILHKFLNNNNFTVIQKMWVVKLKRLLNRKLNKYNDYEPIIGIQKLMKRHRQRLKVQSKFSIYLYVNSKSRSIDLESFWSIKSSKIAKQLTLIHFYFYQSIKPVEFLNENRPNISKMIDFSTKLTYWIIRSIVEQKSLQKRVEIMIKMLEVMDELLKMQNFNALVGLNSALNNSSIFRLNKTKLLLPQDKQEILHKFQTLFDPHWKKLSGLIRKCESSCIPFIGVYLSQLVFLNGQPTILEKNVNQEYQVVSFRKCRKIASVIKEIQQFQRYPYNFKVDPCVIRFLLSIDPECDIKNKNVLEDYLYKQSLTIE